MEVPFLKHLSSTYLFPDRICVSSSVARSVCFMCEVVDSLGTEKETSVYFSCHVSRRTKNRRLLTLRPRKMY